VGLDSETIDELARVFALAAVRELEKRAAEVSAARSRLETPKNTEDLRSVPEESGPSRLVQIGRAT